MTTFSQGQIVLVKFPFSDLASAKRRPAVVISANWFNAGRQHCILAAVTSQVPATPDRDEHVLTTEEWTRAGLPKPSAVKLGKLFTLENYLIEKLIGTLMPSTLSAVLNGVREVIG